MWLVWTRWDQAIGSARRVYACVAHSVGPATQQGLHPKPGKSLRIVPEHPRLHLSYPVVRGTRSRLNLERPARRGPFVIRRGARSPESEGLGWPRHTPASRRDPGVRVRHRRWSRSSTGRVRGGGGGGGGQIGGLADLVCALNRSSSSSRSSCGCCAPPSRLLIPNPASGSRAAYATSRRACGTPCAGGTRPCSG